MSEIQDRQDKKKQKLMKELKAALKIVFARYISAYRESISLSLPIPSSSDIIGDALNAAIQRHYIKAQNLFKGEAFTDFDPFTLDAALDDAFNQDLNLWVLANTPMKTSIINSTNDIQAAATLDQARDILIEENGTFTRSELSLLASSLLFRKFSVRTGLIAETETQTASEATKFLKTRVAGKSPIVTSSYLIIKVWNSLLDGLERDTHREADAQERPVDLAFSVGGASLMYPGDSNGPLREIINCRCFQTTITRKL